MRRKESNLYGNWFISSGERSESSKRVYKNHATTSSRRREMEETAIRRIADDIYLKTLPRAMRRLSHEIGGDEIEKEIKNLIVAQYGKQNVVYDPIGHPEERLPKQSIMLCHGLFAAPEDLRKGMPVWEFIKWYVHWDEECDNKIAEAIEEWSGIPTYLHRATYKGLIDYLRSLLQTEHDNEDKYNRGEIRIRLYLG